MPFMPSRASDPRVGPRKRRHGGRRRLCWAVAWAASLTEGCASATGRSGAADPPLQPLTYAQTSTSGLTVPGTYVMPVGCTASPAVDVFLTLYADSMFVLRQTHRDRACAAEISFIYMGRWTVSENGRTLRLLGDLPSPRRFTVVDGRTLRVADQSAGRSDSAATFPRRTVRLVPFADPLRLRGVASADRPAGS